VLAAVVIAVPLALVAGCSGSTAPGPVQAAQASPGGSIPAGPASGPQSLSETGSTLLFPVLRNWAAAYRQQHANVSVGTAATGSGKGIAEASAGQVDIGASDAYLSSGDLITNPAMVNIPLAVSAQQVNHNVPGLRPATHLKLNGKILAEMYTTETALVIGPGAGASTAGFARVEADLSKAIDADHAVFHSGATAGRNAFTGLDVVIVLAAVLIAAGCAWGLSRRLAEYR